MDVKLEPHVGRALTTGKEIDMGQYRIRVDGKTVGYVGYERGRPVNLTQRFSPKEIEEIEMLVAAAKQEDYVTATQPPVTPPSMLRGNDDDMENLEES